MRKNAIVSSFVIIALVMLTLPSATALASNENELKITATTQKTATITDSETAEEPTLEDWFDENGYAINVTEDELGIEIFEAGTYQITILGEIAEYAPANNLSWYPVSSGNLHLIFLEANSSGDTRVFEATEDFGLCIGTPDGVFGGEPNPKLFYTETNRNPDAFDHALVFANPNVQGGYIIAWEDLWEGGDMDFQDMILALTPVLEAKVYLCPHTLNLKSMGRWITGFIKLPEDYDVANINVSTIRLNGTIPAEPKPVAILGLDCINVKVLMVKFNRTATINLVKHSTVVDESIPKCFSITLTISGNLLNGQLFKGSTEIRVIHFPKCIIN
jgi:hypothetical protein